MQYRALSWERERRVVLVVLPKSGELFPEHFYLITDQDEHAYSAEEILHLYRRRGKAEAHMGELNQACSMALSSSPRPKTHYRGYLFYGKSKRSRKKRRFTRTMKSCCSFTCLCTRCYTWVAAQ